MLYGTAIPPQKDDEPNMPRHSSTIAPPTLLYNNNYSINTYYRTSSNLNGITTNPYGTSRKQTTANPQQQQSTPRKNGGKQKNNGGGGNGGKGNKNKQRTTTTTTPNPAYTTVMLNHYSTNPHQSTIKSKIKSNQSANSSSITRTRPTTKLPNMKNNPNFNNNLLLPPSKLDKYQPAFSNIYEKAPGKAPKQVKENSFTTPRPFLDGPTPNPSITKMFERYEKIQQIFPELEPYKEHNPSYFTVSNGKPSRENSKSFSSFVSIDSMPQKKNTDISTITRQLAKSQTSSGSSNSRGANGNGTCIVFIAIKNFLGLFFFAVLSFLFVIIRTKSVQHSSTKNSIRFCDDCIITCFFKGCVSFRGYENNLQSIFRRGTISVKNINKYILNFSLIVVPVDLFFLEDN